MRHSTRLSHIFRLVSPKHLQKEINKMSESEESQTVKKQQKPRWRWQIDLREIDSRACRQSPIHSPIHSHSFIRYHLLRKLTPVPTSQSSACLPSCPSKRKWWLHDCIKSSKYFLIYFTVILVLLPNDYHLTGGERDRCWWWWGRNHLCMCVLNSDWNQSSRGNNLGKNERKSEMKLIINTRFCLSIDFGCRPVVGKRQKESDWWFAFAIYHCSEFLLLTHHGIIALRFLASLVSLLSPGEEGELIRKMLKRRG